MVNVAMWGKALKVIPRLSRSEWDALDVISRWLIITRAAVFVMTVLSAAVGGLFAYRDGLFSWPLFLACLLGLVFAHATNNLLNDVTDHRRGIDKDNYYRAQYGPQPLEHGLLTMRQMAAYIGVTAAVALAAGVFLVARTGTVTLTLMLAGAFFVLFYTWPLKYIGLGEPSVLLVWGPLMIGGTYYVVSGGHWNWSVALASLAYAVGPTGVLFGKHIDKIAEDRTRGVRTLPVLIGEKAARYLTIAMWLVGFVLIGGLMAAHKLGLCMAVVLLALPSFVAASKVFAKPRPTAAPAELPAGVWPLYLSAHAFVYCRRYGSLFLLGLIGDAVLTRLGLLA